MEEGRALSEAVLQAGLRALHLPTRTGWEVVADLLAALAVGLFLALLIGGALRLFSRPATRQPDLAANVLALRALSEDDRRVALLHLLKTRAPDRYARLSGALYRPGGLPEADALEREVLADA
ncbi:hypothetical protein ATO8_09403 [Roseivivax marinus]|uniref:Uncharacterized protein n=1 Tax=Roseivivax marinus TaxID=1379903 RepID=W4HK04_9RHOB|nr:hypothetical protein [Roseivivax marinus]ETW12748.1 hypothetical protein ATO8_09403 [Roseivivax marinus]